MSETARPDPGQDVIADPARLSALEEYGILDTAPEQGFDDIVLLASQLCRTPVALISFVTADRQWFKARIGFAPCETDLSRSVCAHGLARPGLLVIPDLTTDPRTRDNALVTGEPHIRFYAGARLETPEGEPLGMVCVIDTKPRPHGLTPVQAEALQALARQVMAQLALKRSVEAAHRTLADMLVQSRIWQLSPEIMGVANADGYFEQSNPAWQAVLGWSEAEVASMPFIDLIHPDDLARTKAAWIAIIERGEPALRFENRYRTKDGNWRWLSWVAVLDDGKTYCSARDVTAEKQQARSLTRIEEQLRQSQKMEAVGQLTGGIAHDFNNLLAGIAGSLEMMQARMAQGRTGDIDHYVAAAQGAAKRAAALTHRLLAFSRRQTLAPKPTDVRALVTGMEELIRRSIGPAIDFETVNAAGLWTSLIDPSQLESAVLNLCINARDAMPGGGKITIETGNRWMDRRTAAERGLEPGQYISVLRLRHRDGNAARCGDQGVRAVFHH